MTIEQAVAVLFVETKVNAWVVLLKVSVTVVRSWRNCGEFLKA
jgi:hypothetical protein